MVRNPKNRSGTSAPTPIDHPLKPSARRDEEIEQQAIEDARKSFSIVRDLLKQGVGPDARSVGAKRA